MSILREKLPKIIREPKAPEEFRDDLKREIAWANSRRLKPVTWLLLFSLVVYMGADYLTVERIGTEQAHDIWLGISIMRPLAMVACGVFLWLFGPLKTIDDIKPRHLWVWKAYIYFFLAYTALIVGYMFPLKESIGPIYIFLLGPSAFISMTSRQVTVLLAIGLFSVAAALHVFVPEAATVKYHLINAMIISWVSFVVAHVTYANTFRDFMNRKLIERKNNQLEEARFAAEEANQAKSEFLAAVSHEIRTPMNSILGMTEIALHTPLNVEQRDYIGTARESALHLLDVINDVLDFSRIEARKMRLISAHFDLPAVVQSALKTIKLPAEQKGLSLDMEIMQDVPRFLKGDPGRLRQVLINLLNNAAKFTDEGYIRITVGRWHDGEGDSTRPVGVLFSVKDSGAGVPKDKAEFIFEAFTQADSSASRTYGGSGLGLAICKNLVSLMGGSIRLKTAAGKGSEFSFSARFGKGDAQRAVEPELMDAAWNQHLPIKPSRVLLVDDNPLNVKVEKLHLDRMGMDTTVAEGGAEALMLLAENEFDIVLMDLEMPGMDGHETTRRIRAGDGAGKPIKQPGVPILAVTAHALADVREQCEEANMDGFVTKPVSFGELGSAMRQILGGDWREVHQDPRPKEAAPVLDLVAASAHLGVSRAEIMHLVPNAMTEIRLKFELAEKATRTNTLREVALQTHTLKAVADSIGAEATRRAAVKLENAARREDAVLSMERIDLLTREVERLEIAVKAL